MGWILPMPIRFLSTPCWSIWTTVKITVEVEPEVAEWFKAQGDNYERYLAAALRIYARAHQVPESEAKSGDII